MGAVCAFVVVNGHEALAWYGNSTANTAPPMSTAKESRYSKVLTARFELLLSDAQLALNSDEDTGVFCEGKMVGLGGG